MPKSMSRKGSAGSPPSKPMPIDTLGTVTQKSGLPCKGGKKK
jgi:hypothetical protein